MNLHIIRTIELPGSSSHHTGDLYNLRLVLFHAETFPGIEPRYVALVATYEDDRSNMFDKVYQIMSFHSSARYGGELKFKPISDELDDTLIEALESRLEGE
jgi:hypothetical protein